MCVDVQVLGVVIIVKFGKRSRDQFVRMVKKHVKMEIVLKQLDYVSVKKDGLGNFAINVKIRIKIKEDKPQNHKIKVKFS